MEKNIPGPSKPVTCHTTSNTMEDLAAKQRSRRANIRKIRKVRQALLISLAEDGNEIAKEILQYQDNPEKQVRCREEPICHGCLMLRDRGRCASCVGCIILKNCVEDRRRCAYWADVSKPYTSGTSISAASSVFTDNVEYMAKMEAIFEVIERETEEQETLLESVPVEEDRERARADPIHGESRVRKDFEIEEYFRARLRNLVTAHQDNLNRLADVDAELEDLGLGTNAGDEMTEPTLPALAVPEPRGAGSRAVRGNVFSLVASEPIDLPGRAGELGGEGQGAAFSLPDLTGRRQPSVIFTVPRAPARRIPERAAIADPPEGRQTMAGFVPFSGRDLVADERRVEAKQELIEHKLGAVEELLRESSPAWSDLQMESVGRDLGAVEAKLEDLSEVEVELTRTIELYRSLNAAQQRKIHQAAWFRMIQARCGVARRLLFTLRGASAPSRPGSAATSHLERVQLPVFSGQMAEYPEFRGTFRELAAGYSDILELAQLRNKLHREGKAVIDGILDIKVAWQLLDERFGNEEVALISTLRTMQEFRTTKSTGPGMIEELATAVQRCTATLARLGRSEEFLHDRATTAAVIDQLPPAAKERWFQQDGLAQMRQSAKAALLLTWLARECSAAVTANLEALTRPPRPQPAPRPSPNPTTTAVQHVGALMTGATVETPQGGQTGAGRGAGALGSAAGGGGGRGINVVDQSTANAVASRRTEQLVKRKVDLCVICQTQHFYQKKWDQVVGQPSARMISTFMSSCPTFLALQMAERLAKVRSQNICMRCSSWEHRTETHRNRGVLSTGPIRCNHKDTTGTVCGQEHGAWIHAVGSMTGTSHSATTQPMVSAGDPGLHPALYEVVEATVGSLHHSEKMGAAVLIDGGSDTDFITEKFAEKLGLAGTPVELFLNVVGNQYRTVQSKAYQFHVFDTEGRRQLVCALGLPDITTLPDEPDLTDLKSLITGYPECVWTRPRGRIDILLGLRSSRLHGARHEVWGDLVMKKTVIGPGWVLTGSHPKLAGDGADGRAALSAHAKELQAAMVQKPVGARVLHLSASPSPLAFHELEELGTRPSPSCLACKGCRDCTFRRKMLSAEEQEVL